MEFINHNKYMSQRTKDGIGFYVAKYNGKLIVSDTYNGEDDPLFWVALKDPAGYGDEEEWSLINEYVEETFHEDDYPLIYDDDEDEWYDDKWDNYWADVAKGLGVH